MFETLNTQLRFEPPKKTSIYEAVKLAGIRISISKNNHVTWWSIIGGYQGAFILFMLFVAVSRSLNDVVVSGLS